MSQNASQQPFDLVQSRLGHRFRKLALLHQALVHRSYAHEQGGTLHNEPLEFLGDAVVGFLVAERIVRRHPELDEGAMTRLRARLVNTRALADRARRLGIGEALLLGRGEDRSGGRNKNSLLADGFEAVVGAVFLDGGVRAARALVNRVFADDLDAAPEGVTRSRDPKTALQEELQGQGQGLPEYRVASQQGPDHARLFVIEVVIGGAVRGVGKGSSKKRAEQEAAAAALRELRSDA